MVFPKGPYYSLHVGIFKEKGCTRLCMLLMLFSLAFMCCIYKRSLLRRIFQMGDIACYIRVLTGLWLQNHMGASELWLRLLRKVFFLRVSRSRWVILMCPSGLRMCAMAAGFCSSMFTCLMGADHPRICKMLPTPCLGNVVVLLIMGIQCICLEMSTNALLRAKEAGDLSWRASSTDLGCTTTPRTPWGLVMPRVHVWMLWLSMWLPSLPLFRLMRLTPSLLGLKRSTSGTSRNVSVLTMF